MHIVWKVLKPWLLKPGNCTLRMLCFAAITPDNWMSSVIYQDQEATATAGSASAFTTALRKPAGREKKIIQ